MDDYIKREDAIREAIEAVDEWDGGYVTRRADMIAVYLNDIPAADVRENVRGEWNAEKIPNIYCGSVYKLTCSACGDRLTVTMDAFPKEHFCRSCGADMRGDLKCET